MICVTNVKSGMEFFETIDDLLVYMEENDMFVADCFIGDIYFNVSL